MSRFRKYSPLGFTWPTFLHAKQIKKKLDFQGAKAATNILSISQPSGNHLITNKRTILSHSPSGAHGHRQCLITFNLTQLLFLADRHIVYSDNFWYVVCRVWRLVETWRTGSARWKSPCLSVFGSWSALQWWTMRPSHARNGSYSTPPRSATTIPFTRPTSCNRGFSYSIICKLAASVWQKNVNVM